MSGSVKWTRIEAGAYENGNHTIAKGSWLIANGYTI